MATPQTASELLSQQIGLLSQLHEVLEQEQAILSQRKLDELADIPPQKTKLLVQLQRGDQILAQHDLKPKELQQQAITAKAKLGVCKRLNEENGRMIALAMTSIGKIQDMMVKGSQYAATTTYTANGNACRPSSTGNIVSV